MYYKLEELLKSKDKFEESLKDFAILKSANSIMLDKIYDSIENRIYTELHIRIKDYDKKLEYQRLRMERYEAFKNMDKEALALYNIDLDSYLNPYHTGAPFEWDAMNNVLEYDYKVIHKDGKNLNITIRIELDHVVRVSYYSDEIRANPELDLTLIERKDNLSVYTGYPMINGYILNKVASDLSDDNGSLAYSLLAFDEEYLDRISNETLKVFKEFYGSAN